MASWNPWVYREKLAFPRILMVAFFILLLTVPAGAYPQDAYMPDSLFIVLFSNGDALIEYDVQMTDPLADEVTVRLFGNTTSGLIVTDLEDRIVSFRGGMNPNEIILSPAGATDVRISYSTPDLVGKTLGDRIWTFAIDSPVGFSLKMPPDSRLLEWENNVPAITQIGSQTLLTFRAGNANISYIIGVLGTREAADLMITVARNSIDLARRENPGIIVSGAQELLARAVEAHNADQFVDAERLATQASDLAETTVRDFNAANTARAEARTRIAQAEAENRDMVGANALLEQSDQEFARGDYVSAAQSAEAAVQAIGEVQQNVWPYGIGAAVAGAIAGAFYLMRKRQSPRQQTMHTELDPNPQNSAEPVHWPESETGEGPVSGSGSGSGSVPSVPEAPVKPAGETAARSAGIPDSLVDRTLLEGIVRRIIEESPQLRQEDREVLVFLAESEGAAFESEVRTKFQMPKTTVWRLVKRLEREELVEIRKAGGQNLIKLRFEGRQP